MPKSCLDGYLTEACKTCDYWRNGENGSLGCGVPFPIMLCKAFEKMYNEEERKAKDEQIH